MNRPRARIIGLLFRITSLGFGLDAACWSDLVHCCSEHMLDVSFCVLIVNLENVDFRPWACSAAHTNMIFSDVGHRMILSDVGHRMILWTPMSHMIVFHTFDVTYLFRWAQPTLQPACTDSCSWRRWDPEASKNTFIYVITSVMSSSLPAVLFGAIVQDDGQRAGREGTLLNVCFLEPRWHVSMIPQGQSALLCKHFNSSPAFGFDLSCMLFVDVDFSCLKIVVWFIAEFGFWFRGFYFFLISVWFCCFCFSGFNFQVLLLLDLILAFMGFDFMDLIHGIWGRFDLLGYMPEFRDDDSKMILVWQTWCGRMIHHVCNKSQQHGIPILYKWN